jgi:pimeloyl-ACP methyl ester carboxylesterase
MSFEDLLRRFDPPLALHGNTFTAGEGEPPIVLVSGAGESALDWLPVLPGLAALSRVVGPDRTGFGTARRRPRATLDSEVEGLAAVLRATGPAVVVGHSWGGLLAQIVARRSSDQVLGLVLVDPAHEEIDAALRWRDRLTLLTLGPKLLALHRLGRFRRLVEPMARRLAELSATDPAVRAAVESAYLEAYARPVQIALIGRENRLGRLSVARLRRLRRELPLPDVPLIVLSATAGGPYRARSIALAGQVAGEVRRGRQVLVDAGHAIHHDQPEAVVDAVASILDRRNTATACDRTRSP